MTYLCVQHLFIHFVIMLNVIMFQKCLMQLDKNFWNYKMDQHFHKEKW